eukprot:TRINITY_DN7206_c0_g1_i4.p1 TRINITY_DN7206_c0_g1~~TRINITY_DN7206_c0_g1_i4.p1  ORF type:complete len:814 (-),score=111.55 TRINITY_DN7206_c0_g1_i4:83-2524(-)
MLNLLFDILKQKAPKQVKCQLLQTMCIFLENLRSETSVYYILSSNRINDLITHKFDFGDEETIALFISFIKNLGLKLNINTVQFFFNQERENPFPLYLEAIRFLAHTENMVRIAIRTLTLNVFKVEDDNVRAFLIHPRAAPFFLQFCWLMRNLHSQLNRAYLGNSQTKITDLMNELVDNIYYLNDVFQLQIPIFGEALGDYLLHYMFWQINLPALLPRDRSVSFSPSLAATFLNSGSPNILKSRSTSSPISSGSEGIRMDSISPVIAIASMSHFFAVVSQKNVLNFLTMTLLHRVKPRLPNDPLPESMGLKYKHPIITSNKIYDTSDDPFAVPDCREPNPYRAALVSYLSSHDDRLSLASVLLLGAIASNESIHPEVLKICGILPQRVRNEPQPPSSPTVFRSETAKSGMGLYTSASMDEGLDELSNIEEPSAGESLSRFHRSVSVGSDFHRATRSRRPSTTSIFQASYLEGGKYHDRHHKTIIQDFFMFATRVENREELEFIGLTPSLIQEFTPEGEAHYSKWLVSLLLPIFMSSRSLPLLLATEQLLISLIYHEDAGRPLLDFEHLQTMEHIYDVIVADLRYLHKKHPHVSIALLEDEFLKLKPVRLESLLGDLWSLINNQDANQAFDAQVAHDSVDALRKSIHNYLIFRRLYLRFHLKDELMLPFPHSKPPYKLGSQENFLDKEAIGCLMSTPEIKKVPCYVCAHPTHLLLVEPDLTRLGWAKITWMNPYDKFKVNVDPDDETILHIQSHRLYENKTPSSPAARKLDWIVTLHLQDHAQCLGLDSLIRRTAEQLHESKTLHFLALLETRY